MHRRQRRARLPQPLEAVLARRDLPRLHERRHGVVEAGQRLRDLACAADEAFDSEAAFEDLFEVMWAGCGWDGG